MEHGQRAHFARRRVGVAASAALLLLGVAGAVVPGVSAHADTQDGSTLVTETFKGATVSDSRWIPLGAACLTGAKQAAAAPATGSKLSGCTKTANTSTLIGQDGDGYLQLTDNSVGQSANVLFDRAIPSSAGLDVTFYQYQFPKKNSGDYFGPADGISFFLTDGSYTLSEAGPAGGALGYASMFVDRVAQPGVQQGALAVGLDTFGNFSSQNYVGTSCDAVSPQTPNAVVLRGAGNGTTGYCLINSHQLTAKEPAILTDAPKGRGDGPVGSSTDDSATKVRIVVSPKVSGQPQTVTVYLNDTSISSSPLDQDLPATVKLGFSASTGGGRAAHLIRTVSVKSVNPLGGINLVKSVDHSSATGTSKTQFTVGDTIPYSFLVTNTGALALSDISVTDPKIAHIACPSTTLAAADSFVCTGSYTLTERDVQNGSFQNSASATGATQDGTTQKSESAISVPTYSTAPLSVTKTVSGSAATAVPDQDYTVGYSYPEGHYQFCDADGKASTTDATEGYPAGSGTVTVKADGSAASSESIPVGAVVTVDEQKPADTDAYTWEDASYTPASKQVTIGCSPVDNAVGIVNTATATPGTLTWTKVDPAGASLGDSQWTLTGPNGFSEAVVDNGTNDEDPAVGALKVSGLEWGTYTLVETKAPAGYQTTDQKLTATVSATSLSATFGAIKNTPIPTPTQSASQSPTPSASHGGGGGLAVTGSQAMLVGGGALALALLGSGVLAARRLGRN